MSFWLTKFAWFLCQSNFFAITVPVKSFYPHSDIKGNTGAHSQIESDQMVQWIWHSGSIWSYTLIILSYTRMKSEWNEQLIRKKQQALIESQHWCSTFSLLMPFVSDYMFFSSLRVFSTSKFRLFKCFRLFSLYKSFTNACKIDLRIVCCCIYLSICTFRSLCFFHFEILSTFTSKSSYVVVEFSNCK